jgi:ComF family protein
MPPIHHRSASRIARGLRAATSLADELLDLIAPPACSACDAPCARALSFCAPCEGALTRCPDPVEQGVFAPFAHGGPLAVTVHRAKFGRSQRAARTLGALLRHALADPSSVVALASVDVVVPVPLHPRRLRARGFNQAAEIAAGLGLPVVLDALARGRETSAQARLSREDRASNVRGAFVPGRAGGVEGQTVLLVDDVVTTGATLSAAREALEGSGPRAVLCAAVARAILWAPSSAE